MGPLTLAVNSESFAGASSSDACSKKFQNVPMAKRKPFASVSMQDDKPFDFLRTLFEGVIAGGTAGVVVETALYPIDTIKTRLQAARGGGKIVLKGLYSGLAGNLAGVLPASAIFVGVYEPTKQKLLKMFPENLSALAHFVVKQRMQTGQFTSASAAVRLIAAKEGFKGLYAAKRELNDPENAIIGAFAGALTGAITTPLDVIKTRLMVQGSANQYKGIVDCVQTIVREEGPPALLKGIGPRVLWIGIGGSIFFGVLERTKRLLAQRRPTVGEDTKQD
ncbi:S-adenosylmethionine carrier 1, chloroplastic/mitochondrial isoform X4 [Rosa chinensis]|uniref:S-adenosylmethionine carrier 1, chloroplastic/mitochondrial isoform X4 n=1 Tax=Rosa chinensis TaxID=74649 RepID=UPI000D08CC96|nr:S-adenosylmethionine carrier 1, chloroplastic/mitochondrial isoform X4 [Rosa chinensis]